MVVWRSDTPRVTRITRSAHHARTRARHQRAIRASLPFPSPRAHACLRRSRSGARSLPRLRARGVAGNAIMGAFRCRPPPKSPDAPPPTIPSKPTRSSSPGTTMLGQSPLTRAHCGGGGACSLARSRALVVAVEVAFGYTARHARYVGHASRAHTRMSSPRIARVIAVFFPPRARLARARCSGDGAHSRARLRARGLAVVMVMAVAVGHAARDARNARRASRIRTRVSSPRVARIIAGSIPPRSHAHARCGGGGARSLDSARAVWRWQLRTVMRTSCVSRASRVRAHA